MPEIGDERDLARLRATARLMSRDLSRVVGSAVGCEMQDGYAVAVYHRDRRVTVPIDAEISEDYFWDGRAPTGPDLDADASEAIGDAVLDGLTRLRLEVPRCPEHEDSRLSVCSGVWTCSREAHDLGDVGRLGSART